MIHNRKSFLELLATVDWTHDSVQNYKQLYHNLIAMAELIEFARRGNSSEVEDSKHEQMLYFDYLLAEISIQLDALKDRVIKETLAKQRNDVNAIVRNMFDFGDSVANHYFESIATFNWAENRTEVTKHGEHMRSYVNERGGLIETHWNRQCELNGCPKLKTSGNPGYVRARRHSY